MKIFNHDIISDYLSQILNDELDFSLVDLDNFKSEKDKELAYGLITLSEDLQFYKKKSNLLIDNLQAALFNSSAVAITDQNGIIKKVNSQFIQLTGYTENQLLNNSFKLLNSGFHSKAYFKQMWDTINSGKVWQGEFKNQSKNGNYFWVYTHIFPIKNIDGEIEEFWSIRQNISEKKHIEESLQKANKDLKDKVEKESDLNQELKNVVSNLTIINKFSILIQNAKTYDDVLWSVAKEAVAELGFIDCVIYVFDEKREYLLQRASHGTKNQKGREIFNPIKIKCGEGIVGYVAKSGVSEIVSDTSKDSRYIVDDDSRLSEITVPIVYEDQVIGIIDSEHPERDFFTNNHLGILETISAITATKIIQTQLNFDLIQHQSDLEKTIADRTSELAKRNEELSKMALFPAHNPNPVIEFDFKFNLKFANEAAEKIFHLASIFQDQPVLVEKLKRLLKSTIKGKKTGKYHIKEGFYFEERKFDFNIYIDNEMKFIRLYLNDITVNTKLQNDLKEQNESIVDSLNYSQRIQQSILPDLNQLKGIFDDYFILYKPKDIVSGDFYWSQKHPSGKVLFALNDCTGHGVPGALMSIIGNDALNSIMTTVNLQDISDIVNHLNEYYYNLRINSSNDLRDTMDVMIICYDQKEMCLKFSGSKQRFYLIRDNELQAYSVDSYTLGLVKENKFSSGTVSVKKGDLIYLFTDGYVDQFGGERGKKFKYTRFRDLLVSIHQLPMTEQKEILDNSINSWMKGENYTHEQIDDISVVGFRV